jgi:DNA-directed RNA polymerase subunit RPC12/RpoP
MPPTIHVLLADPIYRAMMLTPPRIPPTLAWGEPWMVWAETTDHRWGRKMFPTYEAAWGRAREIIRNREKFRDVAVVSRRIMFPPPAHAQWARGQDWCSRCRRPSEFRLRTPQHHALRSQPTLTDDDPHRCHYCGIRRVAMPYYPGSEW